MPKPDVQMDGLVCGYKSNINNGFPTTTVRNELKDFGDDKSSLWVEILVGQLIIILCWREKEIDVKIYTDL